MPDRAVEFSEPNRETRTLALLFGAMYFVQGIAEPTAGLIAQPVRSLLKTWGHSAGEIATFGAVLSIPWMIKPVYGLITDFVPLWGSRRRNYLVVATAASTIGLTLLYLAPPPSGAWPLLLAMLLVPTLGVAFSDVVIDALMVETGQPRGITGQLQSVQWSAIYAATILTGITGGWLSAHGRQDLGFVICAGFAAASCALVFRFVREPRVEPIENRRAALAALLPAVRNPAVIGAALFLFLWNFNPFSSAVLYVYMTKEMGFGEEFYGLTVSIGAVAAIVGGVAYGFYCRRVPFVWLIHSAIALGVASTLAYWALAGSQSAIVITIWVGFVTMTATLIQLDLAARACPPRVAGTVFALLMSVANLGTSSAAAIGGQFYDYWLELWGADIAFDALVAVGATFTSACWLLVPMLTRHAAVIDPGDSEANR